jgi:hypothetical protein
MLRYGVSPSQSGKGFQIKTLKKELKMSVSLEIKLAHRIRPEDVMVGFCYAFTYSLLQKLKTLAIEDKLFIAIKNGDRYKTSILGATLISHLADQTQINLCADEMDSLQFGSADLAEKQKLYGLFVDLVEEFLSIFEVEMPKGKRE